MRVITYGLLIDLDEQQKYSEIIELFFSFLKRVQKQAKIAMQCQEEDKEEVELVPRQ